jgi:hypothetical protein
MAPITITEGFIRDVSTGSTPGQHLDEPCEVGDIVADPKQEWKVVTRKKKMDCTPTRTMKVYSKDTNALSDPLVGRRHGRSKFWAIQGDDESDEEEMDVATPTTDEFLHQAMTAGYTVAEVLEAKEQLVMAEIEVSSTSSNLYPRKCPLVDKLIHSLVNRQTPIKPWKGPLPPPRISQPRTFGDALITNAVTFLRGKRMPPPSLKTVLLSTSEEMQVSIGKTPTSIKARRKPSTIKNLKSWAILT